MKLTHGLRAVIALLLLALNAIPVVMSESGAALAAPASSPINHIVVLYLENRSFDNLYGLFPGANGLSNAGSAATQMDKDGKAFDKLPPIINTNLKPAAVDTRFPGDMSNKPFPIDKYVPANQATGDLIHRYYQEQMQINGGKMDKFAALSDAGGLVMGYYDGSQLPLWQYAKDYTLADNFFHAAFGGSFLNHFWLMCACTPKFDNAPASVKAQLDANGVMTKDGYVTPDGFAINTSYSVNQPHPATITDTSVLIPQQTMPNIGDRLNDKNISWVWYSGGFSDALAGKPAPLYQFHHQPFVYFKNYADGTDMKAQHLKDETDMMAAIQNNTLPAVTFFKPIGDFNEHPGYAEILSGDQHTAEIIQKIQQSAMWKDTAIIVTYDENGGLWDHVAPPVVDKWGPGSRVPTLIISPYAKKGFVDHTQYDTTSILKFIETRYDLPALGDRDAKVNDLTNAFDFSQPVGQGGASPSGLPSSGQGATSASQDSPLIWVLVGGLATVTVGAAYALRRKTSR